jgi:hypothetical protein
MPAETLTRGEQIERYVHFDAVETFIQALDQIDGESMFPRSVLIGEGGEANLGAHKLANELWPGEDDFDSAEAVIAESRSCAAVAHAFALLATDEGRDYCARQAARYTQLAGRYRDAS